MTLSTIYRCLFWLALFYSCFMFFSTGVDSGIEIPHIDKVMHFVTFAGLSFLLDFAYALGYKSLLIFTASYGLAVELIQGMIDGRSASIADYIADLAGGIFYVWVGSRIAERIFPRPTTNSVQQEQSNGQS